MHVSTSAVQDTKGLSKSFSKHETRHVLEYKNIARCARFSPDGRFFATRSADTSIKLFEISKIKQMMLPDSKDDPVRLVIRTFYDNLQISPLSFKSQFAVKLMMPKWWHNSNCSLYISLDRAYLEWKSASWVWFKYMPQCVFHFLCTYAVFFDIRSCTLDDFAQAFHDKVSLILGEVHLALLKLLLSDVELELRSGFLPHLSKSCKFLGLLHSIEHKKFVVDFWRRSRNPLMWTEILRQVMVATGSGSQHVAFQRESLSKVFSFRDIDNMLNFDF